MKVEKMDEAFETLFSPMVEKLVKQVLSDKVDSPPDIKEPEKFLTIGQASKEFGCSTFLLQKAISNLELDYYKPENRTYIKRKDVHNYLESIKIRSKTNMEDYEFLK